MRNAANRAGLLVVLVGGWMVGCGGSDRPATAPVEGRVTYRGKPVAGARVVFLCPGAPRLAVGTTDEQGHYRLTTYDANDGAVVGTHAVTVKKYATTSDGGPVPATPPADAKELQRSIAASMRSSARQAAAAERSGSLLPAKYANFDTTDLRKEVVDGENVIDLELTD